MGLVCHFPGRTYILHAEGRPHQKPWNSQFQPASYTLLGTWRCLSIAAGLSCDPAVPRNAGNDFPEVRLGYSSHSCLSLLWYQLFCFYYWVRCRSSFCILEIVPLLTIWFANTVCPIIPERHLHTLIVNIWEKKLWLYWSCGDFLVTIPQTMQYNNCLPSINIVFGI